MRATAYYPTIAPYTWDFYYTNFGLTMSSYEQLSLLVDNLFGRHMKIIISREWEYKSIILSSIASQEVYDLTRPDRIEWHNVIMFNFSDKELEPVRHVAKYIMANFLNETNVMCTFTMGICSMSEFLMPSPPPQLLFPYNHIRPIEFATTGVDDSPLYLRASAKSSSSNNYDDNDGNSNNGNPFGVVSVFSNIRSYSMASLKRVLRQIIDGEKIIVFFMTYIQLKNYIHELVEEERLLLSIFQHRYQPVYVQLNNDSYTNIDNKLCFIKWYMFRSRQLNKYPCLAHFYNNQYDALYEQILVTTHTRLNVAASGLQTNYTYIIL